jgi:dTDP-4-dehydrorhamnose reductase
MKAVVVGGSGQIGGWLLRHLAERGHAAVGTYASVPFDGLVPLDADDPAAADWVRAERPAVVFYPAGFTYVDGCERDPDRARAANVEQPLALARAAADRDARFVYFSTDYVFDGRTGPDDEQTPPHPLQVYGQSKLDAERALTDLLGDALLIVRTAWVYGPERQGKNFAYQLVRTLSGGGTLTCPSDQRSSPSYGPDVAGAVVRLVEMGQGGLIHVAGPEVVDRPHFARAVATAFGLEPERIVGKPTSELGQGAPRPLQGGLRTPRLDALLPGAMRPLDAALLDFLERLQRDEGWRDPFAATG